MNRVPVDGCEVADAFSKDGLSPPTSLSGDLISGLPLRQRLAHRFSLLLHRLSERFAAVAGDPQPPGVHERFAGLEQSINSLAAESQHGQVLATQNAAKCKSLSDSVVSSFRDVDEIHKIAIETGSSSKESSRQIAEARGLLQSCFEAGHGRTRLIEALLGSLDQCDKSFRDVDSSVDEVERFLAIIHDLRTQTNFLALNAAIEAARAGVHGSGFNIVANEMRALADKTGTATEQIRTITERMRASTAFTSETIGSARRTSSQSREQGQRLFQWIQDCMGSMQEAGAIADTVAAAAKRQVDSIQRINDDWDRIRTLAKFCTWDADAAGEKSLGFMSFVTQLFKELIDLADQAKAKGGPESSEWSRMLAHRLERFRDEVGLAEFDRERPVLERAATELQLEVERAGTPSRNGRRRQAGSMPELQFGGKPARIELGGMALAAGHPGCTASVFVCADEEDGSPAFYRIATTLRIPDGRLAIGSQLNPRGRVAQTLLSGRPTYDCIFLLGRPHLAAHRPILSASREVIGAVHVGREMGKGDRESGTPMEMPAPVSDDTSSPEWW